ncbi:S-methyl-5-thioribose-1-phosphate isomerase [Paenactinomyces guangxiensis]|uniref:Methylthioribose-1-phosphate isomerase n=1 Tax=Paenactinomyces guangxiensis TaxID=1490290 RepID=A0A7W1WQY1_9BACL|nr:S-methyl-5-thioribose-1-phosphate isomerase [Paenactinomyces guangxiensis]MBA4494362.1 S-methyl-5-thioribose-1-phosphate isomerase [Paenactinomyces guangxiensis]MBH8591583.1 S-methyl-5-thioribose-1-phosphate isomerase [Paenactinomyces guangxiensis]
MNNKQLIPHPQSILWQEDHLVLLDQRLLPTETVYLHCTTPEEVWDAIATLAVRGAPAIGIMAVYGLYLGIRSLSEQDEEMFWAQLDRIAHYLNSARPTAVNLSWALKRVVNRAKQLRGQPIAAIKEAIFKEATEIHEEDVTVCRQIGENLLPLLYDGMGILTHCNAGGLATGAYGTALAPLYLARERGWNLKVFADETRPVLQGARLTAYELQQAGVDVTLICDNMAGAVMKEGQIQAVIVGTDRVAANGDVANKIGTYSVAVLARAHGIPFYVAAPVSSIDLDTATGDDIPIEQRSPVEVTNGFGKPTAPEGVKVYNPAFDVTPAEYVTAIITEHGVCKAPYEKSLKEAVKVERSL